jgi:valyl-tRNA synthetase
LLLINKYGTDALRYTLIREVAGAGQDISLQYDRQKDESESVEASRNFANKLWNAARFVMMNLEEQTPEQLGLPNPDDLELADRWILSRLNQVTQQTRHHLENYGLGEAAKGLYEFIRGDFCDWYIELVKPRLWKEQQAKQQAKQDLRFFIENGLSPSSNNTEPVQNNSNQISVAKQTLAFVLEQILKLLHPFMPHITEEIWQTLTQNSDNDFLAVQKYPEIIQSYINQELESEFKILMDVVREIRKLRAEANIKPGIEIPVNFSSQEEKDRSILENMEAYITRLGKIYKYSIKITEEPITIFSVENARVESETQGSIDRGIAGITGTIQVLIPLDGLVDIEILKAKYQKNLDKVNKEYESINKRLSNPSFVNKAPDEVIQGAREALAAAETQRAMLMERLRRL